MESYLFEFLVILSEMSFTAFFCIYSLKCYICISRRKMIIGVSTILVSLSIIETLISNTIGNMIPFDYSAFSGLLWLIIAYIALSYATKEPKDRIIFILLLSLNVLLICRSITLLIYNLAFPALCSDTFTFYDILGFGLPSLFITPLFAYITQRYYQKLHQIDTSSNRLWLIPLFFYILTIVQVDLYPADEIVFGLVMKIMIILCAFIAYSQLIQAIVNAANAVKEVEFHKQLTFQLNIEKEHIAELESHAEEMKQIRHDRRQHVQVLRGLLEKQKVEEALLYLEDYEHSMADSILPPLCENFVADTICRRYERLAKQSNIHVSIAMVLPQNIVIAGSDIAIILGNLWENAIAAAIDCPMERRFINIFVQTQTDKILIRMQNSYDGTIYQENEHFVSTKAGRNGKEGIGINSIKAVAEKYEGIADFTFSSDEFTAMIMLYMNAS